MDVKLRMSQIMSEHFQTGIEPEELQVAGPFGRERVDYLVVWDQPPDDGPSQHEGMHPDDLDNVHRTSFWRVCLDGTVESLMTEAEWQDAESAREHGEVPDMGEWNDRAQANAAKAEHDDMPPGARAAGLVDVGSGRSRNLPGVVADPLAAYSESMDATVLPRIDLDLRKLPPVARAVADNPPRDAYFDEINRRRIIPIDKRHGT